MKKHFEASTITLPVTESVSPLPALEPKALKQEEAEQEVGEQATAMEEDKMTEVQAQAVTHMLGPENA